jgi:exonuclease III
LEIENNPDEYLLLSLDANSNLQEDTNGLQQLATECNLVDLFQEIHSTTTEFATQARGSKRIDYMLGTRNIIPYITKIGYLPLNSGFDSDHRAIYADISPTILGHDPPMLDQKYA